jgi:hypothetical protein
MLGKPPLERWKVKKDGGKEQEIQPLVRKYAPPYGRAQGSGHESERGPERQRSTVKDGFGSNGTSGNPPIATSEHMECRKDRPPVLEVVIR